MTGPAPERLTVSLSLEQNPEVDRLLDQLKSRYRLEIIEYDTTGKHLDDTVFYVRYAQAVRELSGTPRNRSCSRSLAIPIIWRRN